MPKTEQLYSRHELRGVDLRIHNLLELDPAQEEALRARILESNGIIRVFVHPYFNLNQKDGDRNKDIVKMQDVLSKMINSQSEKVPPIIIFEEVTQIGNLRTHLNCNAQNLRDIYVVPTKPNNATPFSVDNQTAHGYDFMLAWHSLRKKLKALGVTRVIISGMNFEKMNNGEKQEMSGCVGLAAGHLRKDFEIEISFLNYPHNRKQVGDVIIGVDNGFLNLD